MSNKSVGRPVETNPRTVAVRFKVTREENERIIELCKKIEKNKSDFMRNLVLGNINEAEFFTYIGLIPLLQKIKKHTVGKTQNIKDDLRTVVIMFKVTKEENEKIEELTKKMDMKKSRLLRNLALSNLEDDEFKEKIGFLPLVRKVNEFKDKMKGI